MWMDDNIVLIVWCCHYGNIDVIIYLELRLSLTFGVIIRLDDNILFNIWRLSLVRWKRLIKEIVEVIWVWLKFVWLEKG
jgi:hypothetical protein